MLSKKRPRATAASVPEASLNRDRLVAAALALIDREGLEALSMRKLGAVLGVEGMAIYYYFPNKQALLDAVAEKLLEQFDTRDDRRLDWAAWLRRAARSYRAIALRHPNAFPLLAMRRYTTPAAFRHLEAFASVLGQAGFNAALTAKAFRSIGYFVNGAGLADIATAAAASDPQRRTPLDDFQAGQDFPHLARMAPHLRPEKLDGLFEFGLDLLIQGLEGAIAASPRPRSRRPKSRALQA